MATSSLSLLLALLAVPAAVATIWITARELSAVAASTVALGAAALIGMIQLFVIVLAGGNNFDAMSVVYLDLVVALPLTAAILLIGGLIGRRWGLPRPGRVATALAVAVLLLAPVGYYASHIAPYAVTVDRAALPLPPEPTGQDVVRIGVVTDLQTTNVGRYERRAIRLLQEQRPDVVFVCGDLFQGSPEQFASDRDALRDLFTGIDAPGGVYVVQGDSDDGPTLDAMFEGTSVTYLWNETAETQVGDRTLRIAGLGLGRGHEGQQALDELAAAPPSTVTLALTHRPDWVFNAPVGAVDLMVAGHTHGGQIQIGPLQPAGLFYRYYSGLYRKGDSACFVSNGVGNWFPLRIGAPAEVVHLTLRSA